MIKKYLKQFGIDHLHYMAPIANAPWILAIGILSYNKAQGLPHHSVALWSVQNRRKSKIPGTGKQIHDYVPLYFATHTPMQYVITTPAPTKKRNFVIKQDDLIIIEVDALKVFRLKGVIFTDGNAASNETYFYSDLADLKKLDWENIWLPNQWPQCYDRDWQRKKASEVLVPDHISVGFFSRVVVFSSEAAKNLYNEVKKVARLLGVKPPDHNWTHLLKYRYSVDPTHFF